ncbi:DUF5719 family protein [Paramicrobacterium agarici]|uniref:DUF5719 family protein n=1 Tax=Paramicrobacterium agarici TaxID=630514 RepID=UPI00114DD20D|nr:DUF5719 family protein [Microbacterium agarici]TQO23907.1 hypothetical protein FB385_2773 [Microbacterium agarici]
MRKHLRYSVRMGAGAVTVLALAVIAAAALIVDVPTYRAEATPVTVTPEAADQVRVCPGSLLEVGQEASAATALTRLGDPSRTASASGDTDIDTSTIAAPDLSGDAPGPATLTLPASGDAGTMGASQSQSVGTETIAGFAAAECQETRSDMWFVAGSTDVGRTSLVMLNNPTGVDAMVDIAVVGENGAIDSPNGIGILVEAGSQKVVPLAGIAPNTVTPVVHVTSTGADIQAWVQHSSIRGLIPAGVEMAGHGTDPSESTTIPGVQIYAEQPTIDTQEYDDRRPSLRIYAPSGAPAHVSATVTDESGAEVSTLAVDVAADTVGEYPLTDLKPGRYSIQLDATEPVVAGARTSVADDKSGDFAWFASAPLLESPFVVDAAPGPGRTLVLHNASASEATADIGSESVTIAAGATYTHTLDGPVVVTPDSPLSAAVTYAGGESVSSFTITAPKPASEPVDVYVR